MRWVLKGVEVVGGGGGWIVRVPGWRWRWGFSERGGGDEGEEGGGGGRCRCCCCFLLEGMCICGVEVVDEAGRDRWVWTRSEGERVEGGWGEATEARIKSIRMGEASALGEDTAGGRTAVGSRRRRRLAGGSPTTGCGDWRRRAGLSELPLVTAGTNGCESGTTLGGVPQESDCVRLSAREPVKGGVAAEGAVCGLLCSEGRFKDGVTAQRMMPACPCCSWSGAGKAPWFGTESVSRAAPLSAVAAAASATTCPRSGRSMICLLAASKPRHASACLLYLTSSLAPLGAEMWTRISTSVSEQSVMMSSEHGVVQIKQSLSYRKTWSNVKKEHCLNIKC